MSISALYMQILLDGGYDVQEFMLVARAMERGDDRDQVFGVVEPLIDAEMSAQIIASAMVEIARNVIDESAAHRWRSNGPSAPDPYKLRLGLSKGAWRRLRELIFQRDGRECSYCGSTDDLAVDHIHPLSRGGTNDPENLTPACKSCNSSKRDKTVTEWMGSR